ncbi:MAG TPA: hypothetical protein VF551_08665, partial [Chthoniobacterales bacterium]
NSLSGAGRIAVPLENGPSGSITAVDDKVPLEITGNLENGGFVGATSGSRLLLRADTFNNSADANSTGLIFAQGTGARVGISGTLSGTGACLASGGGEITFTGNSAATNAFGAIAGGSIRHSGVGDLVGTPGGEIVAGSGGAIIVNSGNLRVAQGGRLNGLPGGNFVAHAASAEPTAESARRIVNGGCPSDGALVVETGSSLTGVPSIVAENGVWIAASAELSPGENGSGMIAIEGALHLLHGSTTSINITSSGSDQVNASGAITISGALQVTLANDFVPAEGETFTIITGSSVNGAFDALAVPALPGRRTLRPSYTGSAVVLLIAAISGYNEWLSSHFNLDEQANPMISAATADADHDGIGNKLEYIFASDPKQVGSPVLMTEAIHISDNGDRFLTLTFPRARGVGDGEWTIERSTDLASGTWQIAEFEIIASVPNGDADLLTVKVLPAIFASPQQFFRLRAN